MRCGRVTADGKHVCLACEGQDMQVFRFEPKKEPVTNGDRIRRMTDEQLAHFLCIVQTNEATGRGLFEEEWVRYLKRKPSDG